MLSKEYTRERRYKSKEERLCCVKRQIAKRKHRMKEEHKIT